MQNKVVQKDITFDFSFIFPLFGARKALKLLYKKYKVENIKKSWTWRNPFYIAVVARVNIVHDVDVESMRNKQHELMLKKPTDEKEEKE